MKKHEIHIETDYSRLRTAKPNLMMLNLGGLKHINLRLNDNIILTDFDFVNVYGKIKSKAGKCIMNKIFVRGSYTSATTKEIEMRKNPKDRIDLDHIYDVDVVSVFNLDEYYPIDVSHA